MLNVRKALLHLLQYGYFEKREVIWHKDTVASMGAVSITPSSPQGGTWVGTHAPTWFDEIEIYYVFSTTSQEKQMCGKGSSSKVVLLTQCSGANNRCGERQVTPTATGFTLGNAAYNESANSSYVIPVKIVGVKHS